MAVRTPSRLCPLLVGLLGLWTLGAPSPVHASPESEACAGKAAGDACGLMTLVKPPDGGELERKTVPGVCRSDQCCDLDYSKGSPPETVCHACLACKPGPADATPAPADDGSAAEGSAAGAGEPPRAGAQDPPAPDPSQKRGCHLGAPTPGSSGWLALMGLWLVRRRARR